MDDPIADWLANRPLRPEPEPLPYGIEGPFKRARPVMHSWWRRALSFLFWRFAR